jgi:PilM
MYMIWVVISLSTLAGVYALLDSESAPATPAPSEMMRALNLSDYRRAVIVYALAHPAFSGSVPATNLQMATGMPDPSWRNYVAPNQGYAGSEVVVYAVSTSLSMLAADIEQLAQGSALAGVASNGTIVSPGNVAVPLPGGIATSVPDGALVWIAQAYTP